MEDIIAVLNNREKAMLIWLAFGLALALRSKDIRSSLVSIAETLLSRPILTILAAMAGYASVVVFFSYRFGLWDFRMTKDTAIWLLGPAIVMVFNHDKARTEPSYFKKMLLANLKVVLVVEFLVNFYVFNILVEALVVLPLLFFLGVSLAVSQAKEEYARVGRLVQSFMGLIGLLLLFYALARLVGDFNSFASVATLKSFVLPPALTVLFLPFIYGLAVYTAYELIFMRITLRITDTKLARHTRRQVLRACLFRLSRVNHFANEYAPQLSTIKSQWDATNLISDFKRSIGGASAVAQEGSHAQAS